MLKSSSSNHGPAHTFILFYLKSHHYFIKPRVLGIPCSGKPFQMAGAGYGVTPMSRLSQQSSRRRHHSPITGKPLDLSSPNISTTPTRKKLPKRKTLSSRYTAELPSKRRKLGRNSAIRDPANLDGPVDLSHASKEERGSKLLSTKVRGQKERAKEQIKASSKARTKANGVLGNFNADVKLLGRESDLKSTLQPVDENHSAGYSCKGNHNRDLSTEQSNLKARLEAIGTNEIAEETDRQAQASSRGLGRKSGSKRFPNISSGYRTERYYEAAQPSGAASPLLLSESQAPGSVPEDPVDGNSLSKQDSHLLEGRFLRPRQQAKIKSKSDEVRLSFGEYVGKRVVVYWPHAKAWYAGKVIEYDESSKKHKIKYDDGDEECISFRRHKVVLESPPKQSADCYDSANGVEGASTSHHPMEVAVENAGVSGGALCKAAQLQRDFVEDNALLSAFAIRKQSREISRELSCNGSAKPVGAVKTVDSIRSKDSVVQKTSKSNVSSVAQPNTARTGSVGRADALVYVRRTKGSQKRQALSPDLAPGGSTNDSDSLSGAHLQERPRKRKYQPRLQQSAHVDLPHATLNVPVSVNVYGDNGGDGSASEHALRKRNIRPLKKLVSQVSMTQRIEAAQVWKSPHERKMESRHYRKRKQTGRKPVRKQKVGNLVLNARKRGRPSKRISDDAQGVAYSSLCYDTDKQHGSVVLVLESHKLFDDTIYLALPVVMPELFTWAFFRILLRVNFCEDVSFDERFSLNGSLEDWKSVFRIVCGIVKAISLNDWINGRQWQQRILHELWNVIPRCGPALTDTLACSPPEADSAIVELLRGAVLSCMMTSRQILNLFVRYFIKPYIVATLCERGASFKAVDEKVLLWKNGNDVGTNCLWQSMKVVTLQSEFGSADPDFESYLRYFPRSTDWCTEQGLFLNQLEGNIGETVCSGCALKWMPVPTIKKSNHLEGWCITSFYLVNHGYAIEEPKSRILRLEQGSATARISNSIHCPRHAKERVRGFSEDDGQRVMDLHDCNCLNSALLFTSFLQRFLHEAAVRRFAPSGLCSSPSTKCLLPNKASVEVKQSIQLAGMELVGVKEEAELGSMVVPNRALPNNGAAMKHVKNEPEMMSRRNSSITTESNGAAIKEESSVEMYGRHQSLSLVGHHNSGFPLKADQQHFSGQMDQEYYGHKRSKDAKKAKKGRPRHRIERRESVYKELSTYCRADLLFNNGGVAVREPDVRVEVQPNGKVDFMVAVHLDGTELFSKRMKEVCLLEKNPPELSWESGNGWVIDFLDREQWEIFKGIYNELCIRIVEGAALKEIPVPVVKDIDSPNAVMVIDAAATLGASSSRPYFAIRSPHDEIEEAFRTGRVLYDLDSEDEAWMGQVNRAICSDGKLAIPDYALEQIIDTLEKEAYKRGGQCPSAEDAVEVCLGLGDADILQAVHTHWCNKLHSKGMALLRYFQPPLWQQYQEKYYSWEERMDHPRPVMSAFCLQSRTLRVSDRVLRQRSQRKIKPPSRSSSEDSHRLPSSGHTESVRLLAQHYSYAKPSTWLSSELYPHGNQFHKQGKHEEFEKVKVARAMALEARKLATKRATKLQRRFLELDSALQRAWASLTEYEAVAGVEALAQNKALEERMSRLFRRSSSLLNRGEFSSEDDPPSHSGQGVGQGVEDVVENFARKCSLNVQAAAMGEEDRQVAVGADGQVVVGEVQSMDLNFGGDATVEEAYPLLPISVEASSFAWSGSSLL